MAKYRMIHTEFWNDAKVIEEMTPEDKFFFLYLLTNTNTTQIGIYQITKKQIAFDMGYSIESINSLMNRFIDHHGIVRYNHETREIAIKNWGRYNLNKGGKPVIDCIVNELKEVKDKSLIKYVGAHIEKDNIKELYESYYESLDDTETNGITTGGQKEKEKEKENNNNNKVDFTPESYQKFINSLETDKTKKFKELNNFYEKSGFGKMSPNIAQAIGEIIDSGKFDEPENIIMIAIREGDFSEKRYWRYIETALADWESKNYKTVSAVETYLKSGKNKFSEKQQRSRDAPRHPTPTSDATNDFIKKYGASMPRE